MKKEELAMLLRTPLFADRATLSEAYMFFDEVSGTLKGSQRTAVFTAMGVLLNTVANEINKLEV